MPRGNREYILRYADQALNDMERSLEKLANIREMYGETHPDYAEGIDAIGTMITMAHENLQTLRERYM